MQILLFWHAIDLYLTSFISTSDIIICLWSCLSIVRKCLLNRIGIYHLFNTLKAIANAILRTNYDWLYIAQEKKLDCLRDSEILKEGSISITCTSDHLLIITLCLDKWVHFLRISQNKLPAWHKATPRTPKNLRRMYWNWTIRTTRNANPIILWYYQIYM